MLAMDRPTPRPLGGLPSIRLLAGEPLLGELPSPHCCCVGTWLWLPGAGVPAPPSPVYGMAWGCSMRDMDWFMRPAGAGCMEGEGDSLLPARCGCRASSTGRSVRGMDWCMRPAGG